MMKTYLKAPLWIVELRTLELREIRFRVSPYT